MKGGITRPGSRLYDFDLERERDGAWFSSCCGSTGVWLRDLGVPDLERDLERLGLLRDLLRDPRWRLRLRDLERDLRLGLRE